MMSNFTSDCPRAIAVPIERLLQTHAPSRSMVTLVACGLRNDNKSRDQAEMLEEGVQRHEAVMAGERPEIVGGEHGDGSQDTKAACAEPDPAAGRDQCRAAKFHNDGKAGPEPAGVQSELLLLGNRAGKIEQFCK